MRLPAATAPAEPAWRDGLVIFAVAFTLQVVAQRHAPAAHTALILSLESVFGMIAGMWFLAERPTGQQFAGAGLMLAGVVVSQVFQTKKAEVDTADGSADAARDES